ncbi:MAG: replicative DNA helicase [Proteobacteria bacterium]|nr:replicative DNA helicase [Pseudomonadota bacterium]
MLSTLLQEGREALVGQITTILNSGDFGEEVHSNLFRLWQTLSEAGHAHDLMALIDASRSHNLFTGGDEYLINLATNPTYLAASEEAIQAAATRIKELSGTRTMVKSISLCLDQAKAGTATLESLTTMLEDTAGNARTSAKSARSGPEHIRGFISTILEQVEQRLDGNAVETGASTGFPNLDRLLGGGFMDEDLIVVAARPSMGKTAITVNFLDAAATENRAAVLYSMEMRGTSIAKRAISKKGRIPGSVFANTQELGERLESLYEAAQALGASDIYIDEQPGLSLAEIRARSRLFQAQHSGRKIMIAVDYLQLIAAGASAKPGVESRIVVGEASKGLKQLARELKCPVIALAQLSRSVEQRANKRPMMSDLRESGQIEQDADVIMFLYRDEVYNPETTEPGITEVIVAKQREGATGTIKLAHQLAASTYEDHFI